MIGCSGILAVMTVRPRHATRHCADASTTCPPLPMTASFPFWRKCDLQIHTPRDPNWSGPRPLREGDDNPATGKKATLAEVEAARAAWATDFVDHCVAKKLTAIAITDHHEMTMVPYVQAELAKRRAAAPSIDLWLFPGM